MTNRIMRAWCTRQWNRAFRDGDHTKMNKYGRMYHGVKI